LRAHRGDAPVQLLREQGGEAPPGGIPRPHRRRGAPRPGIRRVPPGRPPRRLQARPLRRPRRDRPGLAGAPPQIRPRPDRPRDLGGLRPRAPRESPARGESPQAGELPGRGPERLTTEAFPNGDVSPGGGRRIERPAWSPGGPRGDDVLTY